MTALPGAIAATPNADAAGAAAWRAMRASADLQFAPIADPPHAAPPAWLAALGRFLSAIADAIARALDWALGWLAAPLARLFGIGARPIEIALVVLATLLALWAAWALLWPRWHARRAAPPPAPQWTPEPAAALALLEDADALAAQGRYGEAARLLLQRSVGAISATAPGWLEPSSTAREIAVNPRLPWGARQAFAVIAREVERSLFALTGLVRADWDRARAAYIEFATADLAGAPR